MNSVEIPLMQHLIKNDRGSVDYKIIFNYCYLTKTRKKFVTILNSTHHGGIVSV